jgi:hypothetical protein
MPRSFRFEDAEFPLVAYTPANPLPPETAGVCVEQGFWGIYNSLDLTDIHGTKIGDLASGLPLIVNDNDSVVVAGHSLGAPLATYLTLDLVRGPLGQRVSGCYFASPHPGNQAFATLFNEKLGDDYIVYNYMLDLVPELPPIGYSPLPNVHVIKPDTARANIDLGLGCAHHIICYLAMLDYAIIEPYTKSPPEGEAGSAACVLGPRAGRSTLANMLVGRVLQIANA